MSDAVPTAGRDAVRGVLPVVPLPSSTHNRWTAPCPGFLDHFSERFSATRSSWSESVVLGR